MPKRAWVPGTHKASEYTKSKIDNERSHKNNVYSLLDTYIYVPLFDKHVTCKVI